MKIAHSSVEDRRQPVEKIDETVATDNVPSNAVSEQAAYTACRGQHFTRVESDTIFSKIKLSKYLCCVRLSLFPIPRDKIKCPKLSAVIK